MCVGVQWIGTVEETWGKYINILHVLKTYSKGDISHLVNVYSIALALHSYLWFLLAGLKYAFSTVLSA